MRADWCGPELGAERGRRWSGRPGTAPRARRGVLAARVQRRQVAFLPDGELAFAYLAAVSWLWRPSCPPMHMLIRSASNSATMANARALPGHWPPSTDEPPDLAVAPGDGRRAALRARGATEERAMGGGLKPGERPVPHVLSASHGSRAPSLEHPSRVCSDDPAGRVRGRDLLGAYSGRSTVSGRFWPDGVGPAKIGGLGGVCR